MQGIPFLARACRHDAPSVSDAARGRGEWGNRRLFATFVHFLSSRRPSPGALFRPPSKG